MRRTDKSNELEKQLTDLRSKALAFGGQLEARGTRIERLIGFRLPLRGAIQSANNAIVCSMLYGENSFSQQLTKVKSVLDRLALDNEALIEARISPRCGEIASSRLLALSSALEAVPPSCEGHTAVLHCGTLQPIYFVRWRNATDTSSFVHDAYSLWFRSNREFSSGFLPWPSDEGWRTVRSFKELSEAMNATLSEDGFK